MSNAPTPKADQLRAMREAEAAATEKAERAKPSVQKLRAVVAAVPPKKRKKKKASKR